MTGMCRISSIEDVYRECNGVLHIGANDGGESQIYAKFNKPVLWIEADPNTYHRLQNNISKYTNQKCINALVTDKDNTKYTFRVASNRGNSSSIFEFDDHIDQLFAGLNLRTVYDTELISTTLDSIINKNTDIKIDQYDLLVLDIQGAELLALKGAGHYIEHFCKYIYTEVSTRQVYKGGVLHKELQEYLNLKNFFATSDPLSFHTNVLYIKKEIDT